MNAPLRFSDLKLMARSALHYQHRDEIVVGGANVEAGGALHALVFDTQEVIRYPGKQRRGKEWDAFEAENAGKLILTGNDYERAMRMATAVIEHNDAHEILLGPGTVREQTLRFNYMGVPARATPDSRHPDRISELKSCPCAEPFKLMWQCRRMLYHAQLAFYRDAVRTLQLGDPREAFTVAVESSAPFPVTVLRLTDRTLEQGERMCRLWFEQLRTCVDANAWPPYVQSIVDWDLEDPDADLIFPDDGVESAGEEAAQ